MEIESNKRLEFKKKKDEFKKLSKEEKEEIILEKQKNKYIEFPYFDKLDPDEKKILEQSKRVYVDPGKRSIYFMIDDEGKIFNYTNKMRITETKRLKYQKLKENLKKKNNIDKLETQLSNFNSRSCYYLKYKKYIKKKNEINKRLFIFYEQEYFRKLNWHLYINKQRSEDRLLNKIKEKYGEAVIIMGDWSDSGRINYMSTPGISLKRKLAEKFKVYNLDEFRTSCLSYKTEKRVENLWLPDKKGKYRKIHSVLTYQMENNRKGCINRDKNAVLNMRKLVHYYLKTGERPLKYRRNVKMNKDGEPIKEQQKKRQVKKIVKNNDKIRQPLKLN